MNLQIKQAKLETLEAIIKEVEGAADNCANLYGRCYVSENLLTHLQAQKELIENEK